MEENKKIVDDFVHLARVALSQREQDVHTFLNRIVRQKATNPQLADALTELLRKKPTRSSPLRRTTEMAVPVDTDSRFQLLRIEESPVLLHEPVYPAIVQKTIRRLVDERTRLNALLDANLEPTRTVLFTGPPGVGKTLAAKWLARELARPLLVLDLSAVMSSYLGRTGTNLRHVLDYAKSIDCILLLDELDAVAKRRDDISEIGELKRLVTVLLQQLDDWPSSGLLIAATNHSDLLDPAVWRRFEQSVNFPLPERDAIKVFVRGLLSNFTNEAESWSHVLSIALEGKSFSDIERMINLARREAALNGQNLDEHLGGLVNVEDRSKTEQIDIAVELVTSGVASQRHAHEMTGVSRDTIRARLKKTNKKGG